MYILRCANGQYYTGSTKSLYRRVAQHQQGRGANFTRKHLPVQLLYYEVYHRIDWAFYREKQIQGWSRNLLSNTKLPKNLPQQILHPDFAGDFAEKRQCPADILGDKITRNTRIEAVQDIG